jgi:hypothetical protein
MQDSNRTEDEIKLEKYRAICWACDWKSEPTYSEERAKKDGELHEQFSGDTIPRHKTQVETIWN